VTGGYGFDGAGKGINGGALLGYNYQPLPWAVVGAEADINAGANGWLGTVRWRVGVPVSSFLVYGTGGLAYGGAYRASFMSPLDLSAVSVGWTAGAGVEYALTPNWSVRGEWLYYDLGQQQVIGNTARLALTYKF
jgi:outer membrane immunogenic protein